MMTKNETQIDHMAQIAAEMTEAMVAGQAAGLKILAVEMQALTQLMPGMAHPAEAPMTDAEIEADFDNMPV